MDPSVASFAQVAFIIVVLAASCSAIVVGLVRGDQKKSTPSRISDAQNLQLVQSARTSRTNNADGNALKHE